jgi:hypothetical protein
VISNAEKALAVAPGSPNGGQTCPTCGAPKRHRSDQSHRLLFAVIAEAFRQWPASAEFQPEDAEHLRAYLLVKARHFDKLDVRCKNADAISLKTQLDAVIRAFCDGKPPLMHAYPWGLRIFKPRSISYAAADRKIFNAVSEAVFQIIENAIGVKIEDLKREAQREAA